jgi:hypothetical protein
MAVRRLNNEIYNAVMTFFIFIAAAILIQKLLLVNLAPWVGVLSCLPCFLAYFAGRAMYRKSCFWSFPPG